MPDQPQDPQALLANLELARRTMYIGSYAIAEHELAEWAASKGAIWGYDNGAPFVQMSPGAPRIYSSSAARAKDENNE